MQRATVFMIVAAAVLTGAGTADAQGRGGHRRDRQEVARAQGVPPGQLPPPGECRVWYDDRSNGRQPAPTSCRRAESIAARDGYARVIYGEDVYRYNDRRDQNGDRAVRRNGRVRDPRISGGVLSGARGTAAYQNGYRDGLTKGREDGEDGDRYDANRHSWYRSATRGYDDDLGTKTQYQSVYRHGFEAGYAEGYRVYSRDRR